MRTSTRALMVGIFWAVSLHASLFESFEQSLLDGDILLPLFLAIGAGFLTSLSPCVYPLIPITLTIIGTRRYESHLQGFLVALSYVLGMSIVYSVLGAIFASIGLVVGSFMQNTVMLLVIAGLFIVMALSLLGAFNVVIPERLLTKLSKIGGQGKRGAFLMGMVAGLLAAPCTGPVLGFILTLIANQSNITQGVVLMLAFSLGMGAPFLILGTFASAITRLPKSGPWMDNIKNFFGAIILGTALYYVSLAVPPFLECIKAIRGKGAAWLVVFFLFGVVLLSIHPKRSRALYIIKHSLGALIASLSIAALLTFDEIPLEGKAISHNGLSWHIIDAKVHDSKALDRLLADALRDGKPVLIDFYADWCVACKQLELLTFQHDDVARELETFTLIRIDATQSSEYVAAIENRFGVIGLPTIVFIDKAGNVSKTRVLGFLPPEKFLPIVKSAFSSAN